MENKTKEYLNNINNIIPSSLKSIEDYGRQTGIPIMLKDTANFLALQTSLIMPKSILEIGTAIGYSGAVMLNACKTATLTTLEKDETSFEIAKVNFKKLNLEGKTIQLLGDAHNLLDNLLKNNQKFDLIFLDGPKGQYINYLDRLIKMLNSNGVLICDNVLFRGMIAGQVETPSNKRAIVNNLTKFNQTITSHPNLYTAIFNIGDGVSVSIYKGK